MTAAFKLSYDIQNDAGHALHTGEETQMFSSAARSTSQSLLLGDGVELMTQAAGPCLGEGVQMFSSAALQTASDLTTGDAIEMFSSAATPIT